MYDLAGIKLSYGPDGTVYYGTPPPPGIQVTSNQHNAGSTYSGEPSPQVDQLALIPSPKLVTLTIGGNDIGFGDVAADCLKKFLLWAAAPGPASLINCQSDFTNADGSDQVKRRIQGVWQPLYDTYTAIKSAVPSGTAIVVLTYPGLLNSQSGGQLCSYVIPSDVPWLMGIQHLLDQTIISAAKAAGVGYLDEEKAFSGHELCTSDPWFHAPDVPPSLDSNVQADYYHPNAEGYGKEASDLHNYLSSIP
jgi:lysophospholipase L1-like esterase